MKYITGPFLSVTMFNLIIEGHCVASNADFNLSCLKRITVDIRNRQQQLNT